MVIYTDHENKQHWPQRKIFKVKKLKSLTRCTALTFISETLMPLSRPLFKDLREVFLKKFKFFQSKDFSLFKYKINYKNLLSKNWKSFENNIYESIPS